MRARSAHHIALRSAVASCTAVVVLAAEPISAPDRVPFVVVIEIASAVVEPAQRPKLGMLGRRLEVEGRGMRWTKRQKRVWSVVRWVRP